MRMMRLTVVSGTANTTIFIRVDRVTAIEESAFRTVVYLDNGTSFSIQESAKQVRDYIDEERDRRAQATTRDVL
jgi:hypothetical protein